MYLSNTYNCKFSLALYNATGYNFSITQNWVICFYSKICVHFQHLYAIHMYTGNHAFAEDKNIYTFIFYIC